MFRVEALNITQTGELKSYFVQGSQRWQSIKLVKGSGVAMKTAGFIATVDQAPVSVFDLDRRPPSWMLS